MVMDSMRLAAWAARLSEQGWLAAVVAVSVFFNVYSIRIFEEEKILLLRCITTLTALGLVVWGVSGGAVEVRSLWRVPLVRATLSLIAAVLLSTACSVAPWTSFWGAYLRLQGAYTWLSYGVIFVAMVLLVRRPAQIERLIDTILLGATVSAGYAVCQRFGWDPLEWELRAVSARVEGTAGNPIFLGAFLVMVIPLAWARLLQSLRELRVSAAAGGPRRGAAMAMLVHGLLVVLLLAAAGFTRTRGPLVGLAVAALVFGLLIVVVYRPGWLKRLLLGLAGLLTVFALLHATSRPVRRALRHLEKGSGVTRLFSLYRNTGKVRRLLWEGATALLASNSVSRALVGYGPDTLQLVYPPFYPVKLARIEARGVMPDRSHSQVFDALIMLGSIGCLAQLAFFLVLFATLVGGLGLGGFSSRAPPLVIAMACGAAFGLLVGRLLAGDWQFSGLGIAFGILMALVGTLVVAGLRSTRRPRTDSFDLLLIGLLAATLAHFVEIQVGIEIVATRLLLFLYAAIAVVAASLDKGTQATGEYGPPAGLGVSVALVAALFTFAVDTPGSRAEGRAVVLAASCLAVWMVGAAFVAARARWRSIVPYAATSLGIGLPCVLLFMLWINAAPSSTTQRTDAVEAVARYRVTTVTLAYAATMMMVALGSLLSAPVRRVSGAPVARQPWTRVAVSGGVLAGVALAVLGAFANLRDARVDAVAKQAHVYLQHGEVEPARHLAAMAVQQQPRVVEYSRLLAEATMAGPATSAQMNMARLALQQAGRHDPRRSDVPADLAHLQRQWARRTGSAEERRQHLDGARADFQRALNLSPKDTILRSQLASLYFEMGEPHAGEAEFALALAIDARDPHIYLHRGDVRRDNGNFAAALADYDEAARRKPSLMAALTGRAFALAALGRDEEAIAAHRRVLEWAPEDVVTHQNLALLYRRSGDSRRALEEARRALALASGERRERLRELIADWEDRLKDSGK